MHALPHKSEMRQNQPRGRVIPPVPAMTVALYILGQRHKLGQPTTPLDLIKLTYLSHGWHLGIYGIPLIEETVQAWPYGPVVPIVYERFKSYRGNRIDIVPEDNSDELHDRQRGVIDATLEAYANYDSWSLSAITHKPGTPWYQVHNSGFPQPIPNDMIQQHYAELYSRDRGAAANGK